MPCWGQMPRYFTGSLSKLWSAYSTSHLQPGSHISAAHVAARVLAAARALMRRDWLLVVTDLRQESDVLSDWLRGRQPSRAGQTSTAVGATTAYCAG